MPNDPYGYAPELPVATDLSRLLWSGVISAILSAVGMCACYIPFFVGAPLGLWSAWRGMKALETATDPRDRTMATAAMVSGLLGGLISSAWVMFVLLYALLIVAYMIMIMVFVGAAGANNF
jgi:hypothetical protein